MADSLDSITIRGFKSIKDVTLEMRRINIVIGANGSGKSNLLGAFEFLQHVRDGRMAVYVATQGGAERVLHFGSKSSPELAFKVSFNQAVNIYTLRLVSTGDDGLAVASETAWFHDKSEHPRPYDRPMDSSGQREAAIREARATGRIEGLVWRCLGSWRLYHLHDTSASSPMRKTARLDDNRFLRADASNLAAFLYLLATNHPAEFERIQQTVRHVAPFFERFDLQPDQLNTGSIKLVWRHRNSDQYFDAASFSDGTLRFIALATLFLQPFEFRPSVILIDEPELGLHPYAIEVLAELVHQVAPQTQVVASTQSSLLLDHFSPEDIVVANRVDGATTFSRLDSTALAVWRDQYSLGQLWERNEFGGRPARE